MVDLVEFNALLDEGNIPPEKDFSSDTSAGIDARVFEAMGRANNNHVPPYGHDKFTEFVQEVFREKLGTDRVYPVPTGTSANLRALQTATRSYNLIYTAEKSHLSRDECGGPEAATGCTVVRFPSQDGKIRPEQLEERLRTVDIGIQHRGTGGIVSITQATEFGTLYTLDETREMIRYAHRKGLKVHMDGARIMNAAASLGVELSDVCEGVDILSFGVSKNGAFATEAVVVYDPELVGTKYFRHEAGSTISKMRFQAVQIARLLVDDLWRDNATQANEMATYLADGLNSYDGIEMVYPVETNTIFAEMPNTVIEGLQEHGHKFLHQKGEESGEVRLMTAWDHRPEHVDSFLYEIEGLL